MAAKPEKRQTKGAGLTARSSHQTAVPSAFDEILRLDRAGFSLLPLGSGDDGKSPMVSFGKIPCLPVSRIIGPMKRVGSSCYGVRLKGLVVVDCDSNDGALLARIEARFGASTVQVTTPRGIHLYYTGENITPPNMRQEGLPVDIKCGPNSYVVGPYSVRPVGDLYQPLKGRLGETPLTRFPDLAPAQAKRTVPEGNRNSFLCQRAIHMVEVVESSEELFGNLLYLRDEECANPATIPDPEVEKLAAWAWGCRLEGRVYAGRNSDFRVSRGAIDRLRLLPASSDAIALYVRLKDLHGHRPGLTFPLQWQPMKKAGHTDLSRRRFGAARNKLLQAGILMIAKQHSSGNQPRLYRLTHVHEITTNVTPLFGP